MSESIASEARRLSDTIREEVRSGLWQFDAPPIEFADAVPGDGPCYISDVDYATFGMILDERLKSGLYDGAPTVPYREWSDAITALSEADQPLDYEAATKRSTNALLRYSFACNPVKRIGRQLLSLQRALAAAPDADVNLAFMRLLSSVCYRLADQRPHPESAGELPWATFTLRPEDMDEDVLGGLEEEATRSIPFAANHSGQAPDRPFWDETTNELSFRGRVVRRYRPIAHGCKILDAFQEEGWPKKVLNPFTAEVNLTGAVATLNTKQEHIRFYRDGSGDGICWEQVRRK